MTEPRPTPDPLARLSFLAGCSLLAFGLALQLASLLGFPGTTLEPDVVGYLSRHGNSKPLETGAFYYALPLLALALWLGDRIARGSLRHDPRAGSWLLLGGVVAAGLGLKARLDGQADPSWTSTVLAPAVALGGGVLLPSIQRGIARLRSLRTAFSTPHAPLILAAAAAIAVFALCVGPRTRPDAGFALLAARVSIALLASLLAAAGLAAFLQQRPASLDGQNGAALAGRALRHTAWLPLARFAPGDSSVALALATLCVLSIGIEVALARRRRIDPARSPWTSDRFLDFVLLPILVAALAFEGTAHGAIDFFHSGEHLTPAFEVLRGERPFQDVYLQHGLIQNVLRDLWSFEALGATVEASRFGESFWFALTHAACFVAARLLFRSRLLALALALGLATTGLHVQARFFGPFLALAGLFADLRRSRDDDGAPRAERSTGGLLAAGACAAFALFWSLDMGIYTAAAVLGYLALDAVSRRGGAHPAGLRPLGLVLAGAAAVATPFVLWLSWKGALGAFLANSRSQVELQLAVWGLPYPSLEEAIRSIGRSGTAPDRGARAIAADGFGAAPFIALVAGIAFLLTPAILFLRARTSRRLSRDEWLLLVVALAGLALFRTALGRSDEGHLRYVGPYLWLLLVKAAEMAACSRAPAVDSLPASRELLRRGLPAILVVLYFMTAFAPLWGLANQWLRLGSPRAIEPTGELCRAPLPRLGSTLLPRIQSQALASFEAFVAENVPPDETFAEFSNLGAAYFLLDRDCPTRYVMPVYAATDAMQQEWIEQLEKRKPRWLVRSELLGLDAVDGVPLAERAPRIAEHLAAHYGDARDLGFGIVYRRLAP